MRKRKNAAEAISMEPVISKETVGESVKRRFVAPKLLKILKTEYVTLRITPDSSVRNWRTEDIIRTIAEQYKLPIDRLLRTGMRLIGIQEQERASFEITFADGMVQFYFHVPKNLSPLLIRRLQSVWDKATVEEVEAPTGYDMDRTTVFESVYKRHDMYALQVDAKDNLPLGSLMEAGRLLGENERASVFTYLDPLNQLSWHYELAESWQKLRDGKVPRKWNVSTRELLMGVAGTIASLISDIFITVSDILGSDTEKNKFIKQKSDPDSAQYTIEQLSETTKKKQNRPGIKVYQWTLVESDDKSRANVIARTLAASYNDLAGDNELEIAEIQSKSKKKLILKTYETKEAPPLHMRYNKMSTQEAGKLIQIPGGELQEQFPEIQRIENKQVEVSNPDFLKTTGIPLGEMTFKGKNVLMHQPTHDLDELCLPHVGIGGMGQGKTKGFLANYLLECVLAGYGGIAIDAAKGEIGEQMRYVVDKGVLPSDKYEYFNLGVTPFALDFCEAMYSDKAKARLASIIIEFFGIAEETSGQTERFLRAAVMGMVTGRISEIMDIFEDEKTLDETIKRLEAAGDKFNLSTLNEYKGYAVGMRRKILSPIYNRMNDILGDPFLVKCMDSDNKLDMVKIMSQRKAHVVDIKAKDLDRTSINIIGNLLSMKIDLAMRLREDATGEEFPFFAMLDEPHQFSKSTKIWEYAVVESRKYKLCYIWTFHFWDQIPKNLQKAIRNALPHYHLYPTTTDTWRSLKEEIAPFTVEDALAVKRWHAINVIRSGGENATPFIAKMILPPMKRF